MDKQEVKDEQKQQELPAEVGRACAAARCELARARMMDAVPTADVVVTNPTHYAVALRYDGEQARARGRGQGQGPCRAAASARSPASTASPSCPTRRWRAPCTRPSRSASMIPEELFQAVAQLLAFVYRVAGANGRRMRRIRSGRRKHTDLLAAGAVVLVVVMMIVPLPPFLIDLFDHAEHLGGAGDRRRDALHAARAGLLRRSRACCCSRRCSGWRSTSRSRASILLHGDAGHVVEAFGNFVVGGNVVVGLVDLPDPRSSSSSWSSRTAPAAWPRSARASPSTPCPASRWRSTPTSTRARSPTSRRASAAPRSPARPTSTARWTAPRSSSRATPWPAC